MAQFGFLTANDLRTGQKVFWTTAGTWSMDPDQAVIAANDRDLDALQRVLEDPVIQVEVVGPYLVQLDAQSTEIAADKAVLSADAPKRLRESLRLRGPSPSTSSHRAVIAPNAG